MDTKSPALLVVLIETGQLRWFVAAIDLEGQATPLLRSEIGDLGKYWGLNLDEQLLFLRHRLCGVLQRGCDRLWARNLKACQFIFLFEEPLPEPTGQLTAAIAEHFLQWLLNPPVVVYTGTAAGSLQHIAGAIAAPLQELLCAHLDALLAARADESAWELSLCKGAG